MLRSRPLIHRHRIESGMDYRTGLPGPGQGAHELRGPLSQSLCMKWLLCISYLWLKEVYFVNLLLALIECTCAVLENVYVRCKSCSDTGEFSYCAVEIFF